MRRIETITEEQLSESQKGMRSISLSEMWALDKEKEETKIISLLL